MPFYSDFFDTKFNCDNGNAVLKFKNITSVLYSESEFCSFYASEFTVFK